MKNKIINYIQIALTIALVIFIGFKAEEFFSKVDWHVISSHWLNILFAGVVFALGYMVMSQHWALVCHLITKKTGKKQWLAYFASQPYKYLPTSIFTFSSRATFAKKLGMNFRHSTEAQLIENFNLVGSSIALGGWLLLVNYNIWYAFLVLILVVVLGFAVWYKRTFTIPKLKTVIDLRRWLLTLGVVSVGWFIMGIGFFVMAVSLENQAAPLLSLAANDLATGLGMVAVFAPGGIGIRELVFSYLAFASTTILLWRFTTFTVDILLGAWAIWAISRSQK